MNRIVRTTTPTCFQTTLTSTAVTRPRKVSTTVVMAV
jgi:hypothetical protein